MPPLVRCHPRLDKSDPRLDKGKTAEKLLAQHQIGSPFPSFLASKTEHIESDWLWGNSSRILYFAIPTMHQPSSCQPSTNPRGFSLLLWVTTTENWQAIRLRWKQNFCWIGWMLSMLLSLCTYSFSWFENDHGDVDVWRWSRLSS